MFIVVDRQQNRIKNICLSNHKLIRNYYIIIKKEKTEREIERLIATV